jgi:PhnB protein
MMASTGNAAPPEGYRSVTPYLAVDGAARAIGFYAEAFGARERMRLDAPGGKIGHAELEIGDSVVMLADPWPGGAFEAPRGESASVSIHIYVSDADAVFARALAAGATAIRPVETHFYGDRGGTLRDPFGHHWHVATRVEDLSPEEIRGRMAAQAGAG